MYDAYYLRIFENVRFQVAANIKVKYYRYCDDA